MSAPVTTLFTTQYSGAVELLLQQPGRGLSDAVSRGSYVGQSANIVDQVGQVKPVKNRPRNSDTPLLSVPTDRRWVYPNDYEAADLIDQQDKLRTIDEITNPCVQTGVMAITRAWDDQILMAAFGTAQTGVQGGTAVPFPGTQSVAANYGAAANVGLTVAKMRKARQLLMGAGADLQMDEIHMAGTSFDHDNLLGETQIINSDYAGNEKAVLKDGVVDYFVGIRFHLVEFTDTVYEAQATMGGATRQLPVWLKSGLHLGVWGDITSRIDERADKSYATQWYVKTTCGAARVQEKKVVQLLCV